MFGQALEVRFQLTEPVLELCGCAWVPVGGVWLIGDHAIGIDQIVYHISAQFKERMRLFSRTFVLPFSARSVDTLFP